MDKYSFRNEVVEPKRLMTVAELVTHCRMHDIPLDSILVFRSDRQNDASDQNVTDVMEVHKYGDLHYVILGGYL